MCGWMVWIVCGGGMCNKVYIVNVGRVYIVYVCDMCIVCVL